MNAVTRVVNNVRLRVSIRLRVSTLSALHNVLCYERRYTKLALRKTGITQTVCVAGMLRVTTHVTSNEGRRFSVHLGCVARSAESYGAHG